ncbi:cupin domain-containing protein [Arthrobacter bambusae]|uniref:cupin domain-containing protein n=1 Tax=Arthrobacter bambusae TaxID=1338426 RepID=UPI001F508A04|nr:cupin domain-containing protein [Arthrobacter bambusae]
MTGEVWSELIVEPVEDDHRMVVGRVRFAPKSRTAWHSHSRGQFLHVLAGVALMQSRGGEVIEVHAGQTVYTPPGEEHWHGATPDSFMEHLAMIELCDDAANSNTWLELVSDEVYGSSPTRNAVTSAAGS